MLKYPGIRTIGFAQCDCLNIASSAPGGAQKEFVDPLREWFKGDSFHANLHDLLEGGFGIRKDIIKCFAKANTDGTADFGKFI